MYDNNTKHKILEKMIEVVHSRKLDTFSNLEYGLISKHFAEPNFARVFICLKQEGLTDAAEIEGVKLISLTPEGVEAVASSRFKKENSRLVWTIIRDTAMTVSSVAVAAIAYYALSQDNSKYVKKDDLIQIQLQVDSNKLKLEQLQKAQDTKTYPAHDLIDSIKKKSSDSLEY